MSILGLLFGRATILTYEILFDDQDRVTVKVEVKTLPVKQEYMRLYGLYLAKIIYNFGGPSQQSALIMLDFLQKIVNEKITASTDCFKLATVDDAIKYSDNINKAITRISGDFYGWKNGNRSITTNFPLNITEQQTVFGGLALMQFAINENKEDKNNLIIFQKMCEGMLDLYSSGLGGNIGDISTIPNSAFLSVNIK